MVRFHWPCDGGQNSFVPPGGVHPDEANGIINVDCEMELSGQHETCPALLTAPAKFLEDGSVKSVGIVLAHGADAAQAKGPLLTSLAVHFAKRGHVVMRYLCKQKEQRRQRIFERSADTAAHSPYARAVTKWIYIGHENGARIAALVGYKSLKPKHGFVFLSYPLLEPAPPPPKQKAGAEPPADSIGPLLRLAEVNKAPQLYINGELDWNCPGADLKALAPQLEGAGIDARAAILDDLDAQFRAPGAAEPAKQTLESIIKLVEAFVDGVAEGSMARFNAPRLHDIVPSARVPPRPESSPDQAEDADGEGDDDEDGVPEPMEGVAAGPSGAPAAMPAGQVPRPSAPAVYGGAPVLMPMGAMQGMHPMAAMQQQAHMQAQLHAAFMQQQAAAAAAATGALHPSRQVLMPQAPGQQGGPGAQNL